MSKDTGGAAFPMLGNVGHNSEWQLDNGMTLRDYFADQAMKEVDWKDRPLNESADDCYQVADAMIAARNA